MGISEFVWARNDDPKCAEWESQGYELVGESWGAHLNLPSNSNLNSYSSRLESASAKGFEIKVLNESYLDQIVALEEKTNSDYPFTPATSHELPSRTDLEKYFQGEGYLFGAFKDNHLIGILATKREPLKIEFDFASVDPKFRGHGIASALGSLAIQTYFSEGFFSFATGGASVNASSKGTVESLGFVIDEFWRSYRKPQEA